VVPLPTVPVDAVDATAASDAQNGAVAWVLGRRELAGGRGATSVLGYGPLDNVA
jgi:hypothetical protein